jgi:hypothetical protein
LRHRSSEESTQKCKPPATRLHRVSKSVSLQGMILLPEVFTTTECGPIIPSAPARATVTVSRNASTTMVCHNLHINRLAHHVSCVHYMHTLHLLACILMKGSYQAVFPINCVYMHLFQTLKKSLGLCLQLYEMH